MLNLKKYLMADTGANGSETADTTTSTEVSTESENGEVATPQEKQKQTTEENAKYAEMRRKAEAETRDKLISEMYGKSHGIHTYAEYQKALQAQQEAEQVEKYKQSNIPEDVAKELLEAKKFRQEYENEKLTRKQQEAQKKDFENFIKEYPDVKAEEIPAEVWEATKGGKSLVDAYAKYEAKTLKAKLAEYEKGDKTKETNVKNADTSTGKVKNDGGGGDAYFTQEQVEKMSQKEINKNWDSIMKSQKKWKK